MIGVSSVQQEARTTILIQKGSVKLSYDVPGLLENEEATRVAMVLIRAYREGYEAGENRRGSLG